ncbi:MAG: sigma-70 family RNA polymerase sigma factor [Candidatus Eisenbacteria bacterium]|nr:sigma-70 family RNA polymerase sigma factor [Candidatus Eisenbacteria bacterium]
MSETVPIAPEKLEHLYRRMSVRLRGFLRSRLRDRDLADDLLHDVFLRIHDHAGELRDEEKLESWIWRITRNAIIDQERRSRSNGERNGLPLDALLHEGPAGGNQAGSAFALEAEEEPSAGARLRPTVRRFIDILPPEYREALLLTEFEGLSQKDLAERLSISHSGAKSRVQRARKLLLTLLHRCCHLEFDRRGGLIDYRPRGDALCPDCHDESCGTACEPGCV